MPRAPRSIRWEISQLGLRRNDAARPAASRAEADHDSWWIDVLHDPRARWPSERRLRADGRYAHLRLDRCRSAELKLSCDRCGQHRSFRTDDVVKAFGADCNTV